MSVVRCFLPFRTIFPDFLSFSIHSYQSCTTQTFAILYIHGQKKSRLAGGGWRLSENAGSAGSQSFPVLSEHAEMLEQDLNAHKDEHSAAEQLRAGFVLEAEHMADLDADAGQHEGRRTDKADRRKDADLKKGKGDADGERIDAGRDGQRQHRAERKRVAEVLLIVLARLADHVRADEAEQNERDPVVDACDKRLKAHAEREADERHEHLKTAEINADRERVLRLQLPHTQPLADRNGEGIH